MKRIAAPRRVVTRPRPVLLETLNAVQAGRDVLAALRCLHRCQIEALAEASIALLDEIDGDGDIEANGDELDFTSAEDDFAPHSPQWGQPGCPVSDPGGDPLDDGEDEPERSSGYHATRHTQHSLFTTHSCHDVLLGESLMISGT